MRVPQEDEEEEKEEEKEEKHKWNSTFNEIMSEFPDFSS